MRLIPDATHDPIKECRKEIADYKDKGGDGCRYDIPLGPPIVELRIDQLKLDLVDKARIALAKAARIETLNLTYRRLNVHFSQWTLDILTNDDSSVNKLGQFYAWNTEPGRNTPEQLRALLPIIVALAHNLKWQKRFDELSRLKGIFQLIPEGDIPDFVRTNIPEIL